MKAYVLGFGEDLNNLAALPTLTRKIVLSEPVKAGFTSDAGPAIDVISWPRGTRTGFPMWHALTVEIPEEYRRKGSQYVGLSFFQSEG